MSVFSSYLKTVTLATLGVISSLSLAIAAPTPLVEAGDAPAKTTSVSTKTVKSATSVSQRVSMLKSDWQRLKTQASTQSNALEKLRKRSENVATDYYATVALINAKLQRGTTPGNPEMVEMSQTAQARLDELSTDVAELNTLSSDVMHSASMASFLLESVRATYSLSGAYERDHEALRAVEDDVNQTVIKINRQLNSLSDDLDRRASTLATERRNMQTLALAINNGQLYGKSISNRAFLTSASPSGFAQSGYAGMQQTGRQLLPQDPTQRMALLGNTPPIVMIRFDRPDVDYAQALYLAASESLEKFPNANFELVAVSPAAGNPAQAALASSDARANAESALRALSEMGVPADRIRLSAAQSVKAQSSEVHLFLR